MARETKAERLAREAAAREVFEAEMVATYPQRLMEMLERATKSNWELKVREGKFVLKDGDDGRDRTVELTLVYTAANQEALHELDWRVDLKEEEAREEQHQRELRRGAFNKLTKEEQTALGLSSEFNW